MQTCYNCGKQVADEVLICPDCGALVKRYTTPPQREAPVQQPIQPAAPVARRRLYRDENGKPRLTGGITAWLIISLCFAGYFALSVFSSIYISSNASLFIEMFAEFPELEPLTQIISELADTVLAFPWLFIALSLLLAAKTACGIWFLVSKARLAHTLLIVITSVLAAILLFCGGLYGVWMLADALVTALLLRADRGNMR